MTAEAEIVDSRGRSLFLLYGRVSPSPGGGYVMEGTIKFTEQEQAGQGEMTGDIKLLSQR